MKNNKHNSLAEQARQAAQERPRWSSGTQPP